MIVFDSIAPTTYSTALRTSTAVQVLGKCTHVERWYDLVLHLMRSKNSYTRNTVALYHQIVIRSGDVPISTRYPMHPKYNKRKFNESMHHKRTNNEFDA